MIYVLIFLIAHKTGYDFAISTTTAEYNTKEACQAAAADMARYTTWADRREWSCMPKGEKK